MQFAQGFIRRSKHYEYQVPGIFVLCTSFKAGNNLWSSQWRFLGLLNWKLFMGLFSSTFWTYNPFKSIQEENSRRLPVRGESTTSQGLRKHETTVYHKIQTWATLSNSRFCLFHTFERIIQRSTGLPKSGTQLLTSNKICSSENFSISKLFCQAVKNSSRQ